jgi:putative YhbY family RNA-binding protein
MKELSPSERRSLRARAHSLHPVVAIGHGGLTETVLAEIDRSLKAHELIKVRVFGVERAAREALLAQICEAVDGAPVQHIGNVLVVFREKPQEPAAEAKPGRKPAPRARRATPLPDPRRRLSLRKA